MKKFHKIFILLMLIMLGCTGCKKEITEKAGAIDIYYLNNDITSVVPYEEVLKEDSADAKLKEVMDLIQEDPVSIDCKRAFTDDIQIVDFYLENRQLVITFNEAYQEMDATREILCRAAIVKTVTQLDSVDYVIFYVGDAPLTDYKGNPVGVMTDETFIENAEDQINSVQAATLTLYFANKNGDRLVEEIQNVHYSSNMPIEKVVIEQLVAGPTVENGHQAICPDTKLLSVASKDGVCYVDFDEKFLEGVDGVTEEAAVYSIVNSLSEVANINKVQISVNGETEVSNDTLHLNTMFERNLDIIDTQVSEDEEVELP